MHAVRMGDFVGALDDRHPSSARTSRRRTGNTCRKCGTPITDGKIVCIWHIRWLVKRRKLAAAFCRLLQEAKADPEIDPYRVYLRIVE